ncbi:CHAD domain-containing protein [Paraburkholderia lacunae]|nr:CHAD domain-containing protein [Paraburkholderia lacunae]
MVAQVARQVCECRLSADPESLHKLRVALRRLRSLWWAYEKHLNVPQARLQRREFKSLADAAGQTRDWDILKHLLTADKAMKRSFKTLIERVDVQRSDALLCSRRTIEGADVGQMLEQRVADALRQLNADSVHESLELFASERVASAEKALKKRVNRVVTHLDPEYAELHEVRIAGKKLRYLLEFFSPLIDSRQEMGVDDLAQLQDELGKLNDIVSSDALLREHAEQLGEHAAVENAISYLTVQKEHHMQRAYEMLRAVGAMRAEKRPDAYTG